MCDKRLAQLFGGTLLMLPLSGVTGVAVHFTCAGLLSALGLWHYVDPFLQGLPSVHYYVLLGALALPHLPCLGLRASPMIFFVYVLLF